MKNIVFILILLIPFLSVNAQDAAKKSRKERKAEREAKKMEKIKNLVDSKTFEFDATHVMPMGGGTKYLNYDYDVKVEKDTVDSYLPFYGVAYHVDYNPTRSAFDFKKPIEEYKMEKEKDGYMVNLETHNGMDHINYTFHISDLGFTTLHVTSTNRQSISYYGTIKKIEKQE